MLVVLAHVGHWLEGVAIAAPALLAPLSLAFMAWRERARGTGRAGPNVQ